MSGTADKAPSRAKMPCCGEGIKAPNGWFDRIDVHTTVAHAPVVASPVARYASLSAAGVDVSRALATCQLCGVIARRPERSNASGCIAPAEATSERASKRNRADSGARIACISSAGATSTASFLWELDETGAKALHPLHIIVFFVFSVPTVEVE